MLWAHDAKKERRLVLKPDSEGRIKPASGKMTEDRITDKAAQIWVTATRVHYNRDLRFNSQSLIVAMTNRPCIGGRAWPSVIFQDPEYEYAFALWCNSTLGLLMHWWATNKTQSGRGTTTVTGIPNIPTVDVRTLTKKQLGEAKRRFQCDERVALPSLRPDRRGSGSCRVGPTPAGGRVRSAGIASGCWRTNRLVEAQASPRATDSWG